MNNPLSDNSSVVPAPITPGFMPISGRCCGEANIGENGVEAFIELSDTPSSYAGQAGKLVGVKSDETGLEFKPNSSTGWRPTIRVSRDDIRWIPNSYTYTDNTLVGAVFFVYYNGVKILTPEMEGFAILSGGGFTFDPARFQFYEGEYLYLIF